MRHSFVAVLIKHALYVVLANRATTWICISHTLWFHRALMHLFGNAALLCVSLRVILLCGGHWLSHCTWCGFIPFCNLLICLIVKRWFVLFCDMLVCFVVDIFLCNSFYEKLVCLILWNAGLSCWGLRVEYCFTSHQLIYGHEETDDDNDDERDRNLDLHSKNKGSFTSHTT